MPLNRDLIPAEVLTSVNTALDSARAQLGFTTDRELANHWQIAPKTLSQWRNGVWPDNDAILIGALVGQPFWTARPVGQRRAA